MSHKRSLDVVAPEQEQEAAHSPRRRLRRTGLVVMWLERRRARGVTIEQMAQLVRQMQVEMAKLFMFLMVLVARLDSIERLLVEPRVALQRLLAEQLEAFQRSFVGSIHDKIRSAVQTELQERQIASLPNGVYELPRQISKGFPETGGITRMVKLCFVDVDRPKDPLYTHYPVQWQNGANAKVAIFENERQITQGDLSKLQIEILPVHADFFTERGQADFTKEEFNKQIYTHNGKESVLKTVNLTNGEAHLGSFVFTESSHRKMLRLTARVKRQDIAVRVQEAITDPFVVKDRRSELNEKSYPPSKEEAVHRLEKISLKGKRCNDLAGKNITTVKHLMRHYQRDKSGLQKLTGMKKEDWTTMIKHASTSDPGAEVYSYRVEEENYELLFNDFYDLVGMIINGSYVPYKVNVLDQFRQLKVNNWKMSAHKKFEELENSGSLIPDYVMINGLPVCVPLNNKTTWQCSNDMTAQQEFGERQPFLQQNGFSQAPVCSNNDAGPSKHETLLLSQYTSEQTTHQELGQQDPSMPQNGTPCYLTQGNILNGQGSFSAESTIPFHKFSLAQEDELITGARLTAQCNGYLSSLTTEAPGTSYPVTDGVSQPISPLNHVETDISSWLSSFQEELLEPEAHVADYGFVPANNAELPNFNNQCHGYEHDDGNQ